MITVHEVRRDVKREDTKGISKGSHNERGTQGDRRPLVPESPASRGKPPDVEHTGLKGYKTGLKCFRCGSERHTTNSPNCFAKSVTCHKCGKKGHYARVCQGGREQVVRSIEEEKFVFSIRDNGVVD